MAVLYIFAAIQTDINTKTIIQITERHNSQIGTPKGIRIIIATGEVNGIIESQNATSPEGFSITIGIHTIVIIIGIVIGNVNCCPSVSVSIREPIAPNKAP